jgi:hypothetical protein
MRRHVLVTQCSMPRTRTWWTAAWVCLAVATLPGRAGAEGAVAADDATSRARRAPSLDLFAAPGYLGSPTGCGGDVTLGARLGLLSHLATSLDLGYGLLSTRADAQDRWWAIPSIALVIPAGRATFDLGAGVGVGTASGYDSWSFYFAHPFGPGWHYTVPAAQAHLLGALSLTPQVGLFARLDAGTLLGVTGASLADTTWYGLAVGIRTRLL